MKHILILIVLGAIMSGCSKTEYKYTAYYIYKNEGTKTITVSSYSPINVNGEWKEGKNAIFTIAPNQEYTTEFNSIGGFSEPLHWYSQPPEAGDSTIVSNGMSRFVHYYKNKDELYLVDKYEKISDGKYERKYRYTFKDEDFE